MYESSAATSEGSCAKDRKIDGAASVEARKRRRLGMAGFLMEECFYGGEAFVKSKFFMEARLFGSRIEQPVKRKTDEPDFGIPVALVKEADPSVW